MNKISVFKNVLDYKIDFSINFASHFQKIFYEKKWQPAKILDQVTHKTGRC